MKMEKMMNKIMNRFFYLSLIGLLGLTLVAAFTRLTNAQADLKKMLSGESSKRWELRDVKLADKSYHEEDFNNNDEFELKNDVAQIVPDIIVFHADGTCEMTYVSQYKDGKVVEGDFKANGKWSVEGETVEIIENANGDNKLEEARDEIFWLKDLVITEKGFKSKFSLEGDYTGGVQELGYETDSETASADTDENDS